MQTSRFLSRLLTRPVSRQYSSAPNTTIPTLNEMPQPCGDWKTNYDALNRKYTLHLILGVGVFVGTLVFGKAAGLLEFYNDYPEKPAEIENYKTYKK